MGNIDFSKAPEGATYYKESEKEITWYKKDATINPAGYHWCWWSHTHDSWITFGVDAIQDGIKVKNKPILIECKTEREVMLCEQVLRMCRGEKSQFINLKGEWMDDTTDMVFINEKYRAKPKKELIVPWDILSDEVTEIKIDKHGNIYDGGTPLRIKLDLTDIELPVTVKRPSEK